MARVLVVEDNLPLAEGLAYNLRYEGHEARIADNGRTGLADVREWKPDLVILDLTLPELDGFEVLAAVRHDQNPVPVIILSARGEEADKVRGFRLDADQYVTKPFGVLELLERVNALLRRARQTQRASGDEGASPADRRRTIRFGSVVIDTAAHTVSRGGQPCVLSPKAYELLLALVRRAGGVASRAELLREVWGYGGLVLNRTVDSHVVELRRALEDDAAHPRHIVTVWKVGYRFES